MQITYQPITGTYLVKYHGAHLAISTNRIEALIHALARLPFIKQN